MFDLILIDKALQASSTAWKAIRTALKASSWIWDKATVHLFRPTYVRSHNRWLRRHRLGSHWESFDDVLEYSIYLPISLEPEPRTPLIAFRSKNDDVVNLSVVFEAESDTTRFQEKISVVNLTKKPIICKMSKIPHQEVIGMYANGWPRFLIDEYRFLDWQIQLTRNRKIHLERSVTSHLMQCWAVNSTWSEKWECNWNLDAIVWAKRELAIYWQFGFGMPRVRIYGPGGHSSSFDLTFYITRPIAKLMSAKFAVSIQFWVAIWSTLWILNDDDQLQWRCKKPFKEN
jgi:hypothetical protein